MNNKNKETKKKISITFTTIGLLLVIAIVASLIFQDNIKTISNDARLSIENHSKPKFAFDTAQFPDWATAGNVYVGANDTSDNKVEALVSAINISQCDTGSECSELVEKCRPHQGEGEYCEQLEQETAHNPCFVLAHYSKRTIDVGTARSDQLKRLSNLGTKPTEIGVKTLTMQTQEGERNYALYQLDTNNKDTSYRRGSAFGFITLKNGHVQVQSVCWQASQLDETLPILSAIRLEV